MTRGALSSRGSSWFGTDGTNLAPSGARVRRPCCSRSIRGFRIPPEPQLGATRKIHPGEISAILARLFERKSPAADGAVFLSGRWGGVRVLVLPRLERVPGDEWKFSLYLEPWSEKAEQADPYRDEKKKT